MNLLYHYRKKQEKTEETPAAVAVKVFHPSFRHGFLLKKEPKSMKTLCLRMLFQGMSFGRARIFYAESDEGEIAHTSYVIPKCLKFAFMKAGDFEIGPCFTAPASRGKGIYPTVIRAICKEFATDRNTLYMIVKESNTASIRGIEKAGFEKCGIVKKSKILKRYISEK